MAQLVEKPSATWETWVWFLGCVDPLKKGKATHSSILAGIFNGLYGPWGHKESDTTEQLSLTHSYSLIILVMSIISIMIVPLCSLEQQILFSPPDTSTTECHFYFGPAFSFFLELFLCSSQVAYWTSTNLGGLIFPCHIFLSFHTVRGVLEARILRWFAIAFSLNCLVHSFIEIHKVMLNIL